MSNSMILAAILKICELGHQDVISQLANIGFQIQHTKLPLIKVSNPFLHKISVLVNFSDFFFLTIMIVHTLNMYTLYLCTFDNIFLSV